MAHWLAGAVSLVAGGYFVANFPWLHRGASGLGSCSTADDVCAAAFPNGRGLAGKTAVVTGASSGLGRETALALAKQGARVWLPCRSLEKAKATVEDLSRACLQQGITLQPDALVPAVMDLSDLASVRDFSRVVRQSGEPVDLLINNAGIMALPERQPSAQGLESQVAVCHLAHFLLFKQLLPQLRRAKDGARVVAVSSMAHRRADTRFFAGDNKNLETVPYTPWTAYGNAKMSNVVFAREIEQRYGSQGVHGFSLHPGGIHTNLQKHVSLRTTIFWALVTPFFFKSPAQGAATSVYCAVHPKAVAAGAGRYHSDCNPAKCQFENLLDDAQLRRNFWANSEALVKPFCDEE